MQYRSTSKQQFVSTICIEIEAQALTIKLSTSYYLFTYFNSSRASYRMIYFQPKLNSLNLPLLSRNHSVLLFPTSYSSCTYLLSIISLYFLYDQQNAPMKLRAKPIATLRFSSWSSNSINPTYVKNTSLIIPETLTAIGPPILTKHST